MIKKKIKQKLKELKCLLKGGHDYKYVHVAVPPVNGRTTWRRIIVCKCMKCGKLKPKTEKTNGQK